MIFQSNDHDDVQVFFCQFMKLVIMYRPNRFFLTWMYSIAQYKIKDYLRVYYNNKSIVVDNIDVKLFAIKSANRL